MKMHTPGPWTANGWAEIDGPTGKVAEVMIQKDWQTAMANAQLIAQAPWLLATLDELDAMGGLGATAHAIIRQAIDRATKP